MKGVAGRQQARVAAENSPQRDDINGRFCPFAQVGGGTDGDLAGAAVADQEDRHVAFWVEVVAHHRVQHHLCHCLVVDGPVPFVGGDGDLQHVADVDQIAGQGGPFQLAAQRPLPQPCKQGLTGEGQVVDRIGEDVVDHGGVGQLLAQPVDQPLFAIAECLAGDAADAGEKEHIGGAGLRWRGAAGLRRCIVVDGIPEPAGPPAQRLQRGQSGPEEQEEQGRHRQQQQVSPGGGHRLAGGACAFFCAQG